ncbi:MAG: hypothetical protein IJ658_11270, partial [Kiritimatiellae bacterium]|nr:hypothetical protein [Kiritimatiellia bacterium]
MKKMLVATGILAALGSAADVVTNSWVGADGGAWGTPSNWSANHVPDGDEYVIFPDTGSSYSVNVDGDYQIGCFYVDYRRKVNGDYDMSGANTTVVDFTLTGSGTVTATGNNTSQHCVRINRRLVMDGPTLDLRPQNRVFLVYNGMVVKTGSTNYVTHLTLHWNNTYLNVEGGFVNVDSRLQYRRSGSSIRVSDGAYLSASALQTAGDSDNPRLAVTVDGGVMTINTTKIVSGCSLTFNGGEYRFRGATSIDDDVPIAFNGGTNSFYEALTDPTLFRRFLVENTNTVVQVLKGSSDAVIPTESCTISAPLEIPGGGLRFTNAIEIAGSQPLMTRIFHNLIRTDNNVQSDSPTIRFPTLVFGNTFPFTAGDGRALYIEGPTTFRSTGNWTARPGRTSYPVVSGPITIDTRDWYDESVAHTVTYALGTYADASLVVTGGGTVSLVQQRVVNAHPFNSVTVEANTTLNLTNTTDSTDTPLITDSFTLGPNATLNMTVGGVGSNTNALYAAKWNVDPTARINVIVRDDFAGGAVPVLVDTGSNAIGDFADRITVSGASAGGSLVRAGGSLVFVRKVVTTADGTYPYEWTGAGSSAKWTVAANWYGGVAPPEHQTCAFGAMDSVTTSSFDKFTPAGSTIGRLMFRDTTTSSFTVSGNQITYNDTGASVVSYSSLPQYIATSSRSTANIGFAAYGFGPLVFSGNFASKANNKIMSVLGDVRTTAANAQWPLLSFSGLRSAKPWMTRLFVAGGDLTFTNQVNTLATAGASLRVAAGAKLTFKNGTASSKYQWTAKPARIVLDGTLDLQAPFFGGADQTYGGDGTLKIASLKPAAAASRVSLSDTLTVEAPAAWPTVDADGAETPLTLGASSGRPVIHAANGWTYGPADGTATATAPSDRAAYIRAGATLAVEPGGGVATFVDPVAGPGTLEITNGTLKVTG